MRARLMRELAGSLLQLPPPVRTFYRGSCSARKTIIMRHTVTRRISSCISSARACSSYCYAVIFSDLTTAMCLGLASLLVRQFGHAVIEPACHDKEELLLGYTPATRHSSSSEYLLIPVIDVARAGVWTMAGFTAQLDIIALHWFRWTAFVVLLRVSYLIWKHDLRSSMIWFVKLITDPFTDIVTYFPRRPERT